MTSRTRKSAFAANWERAWRAVADDARPASFEKSLLQAMLSVVAPFYRAGAELHRLAHGVVLPAPARAGVPVICVGNLSLGGTGKTPLVADLARRFHALGARPVVVTRGYASEAEAMCSVEAVVVSDGERLQFPVQLAGDEAAELASVLPGVPVIAGARRAAAARFAVRRFSPGVILLDDGFQHHALARDCNVVALDATRPLHRLRQFPRGSLRESPTALRRAQAVVLTRCEQAEPETISGTTAWVRKSNPAALIVEARLRARGLATLEGDIAIAPPALQGATCAAFCGIGNPLSFRRTLEAIGLRVFSMHTVPDHSGVDTAFLERIRSEAQNAGAAYVVCTRKDAVKLSPTQRGHAELPVLVPVTSLDYQQDGRNLSGDTLAELLLTISSKSAHGARTQ